jgi:hypothetical protein
MDPRIKEPKLKSIWIECTSANDDDAEWCQYALFFLFANLRYFSETMLENKEQLKSSEDVFNLLKSDLENLSVLPNVTDDGVKRTLCGSVWEKVKKPEPTATKVILTMLLIYLLKED